MYGNSYKVRRRSIRIKHITPIFKRGERKNCDIYCAISVTSTFSSLCGRIIRDLIETEYKDKEAEEQAGYRAGRSCKIMLLF
jgi:hypothetical protein